MRGRLQRSAFSLIEVTLALGIASFVLVGLLGLTSVAFRSMSESGAKLEAASAASEVATRWRSVLAWNTAIDRTNAAAAPADFPLPTSLPSIGQTLQGSDVLVSSQGMKTSAKAEQKFRLAYQITRSSLTPTAVQLHLRLSWPAGSPDSPNVYEVVTSTLLGGKS